MTSSSEQTLCEDAAKALATLVEEDLLPNLSTLAGTTGSETFPITTN